MLTRLFVLRIILPVGLAIFCADCLAESARFFYQIKCLGCHPVGLNASWQAALPRDSLGEYRQTAKAREFFIRVPAPDGQAADAEDRRLLADLMTWSRSCRALLQGASFFNLPDPRPARVETRGTINADLAELGRYLYFDTRLSNDGGRSCTSCHDPGRGWADGAELSKGYVGTEYFRNSPSLLNVAGRSRMMWDGRIDNGDMLAAVREMVTLPPFMRSNPALLVERISRVPQYMQLWDRANSAQVGFTADSIYLALREFLLTVKSDAAPFDRFGAGDRRALSAAARRGSQLFTGKAGCSRCHRGPGFSDSGFHRLGVPENPNIWSQPLRAVTMLNEFSVAKVPNVMDVRKDIGRAAVTGVPGDTGRFLTPGLRDLVYTAPYMHNGVLRHLEEVVEFYDRGGGAGGELVPLHLARQEKADLVAFLRSLSGGPVAMAAPVQPSMQLRQYVRPGRLALGSEERGAEPCCRTLVPIGPLPPVPGATDDPKFRDMARLGQMLFWDPRVSGDGSTPCVSCHFPELGWSDGNAVSRGYPGTQQLRNAGTILNSAFYERFLIDGAFDSLDATVRAAATSPIGGNADEGTTEMRLRFVPEYVARFRSVFGTEWPTIRNAWASIAAFVRTVVSNPDEVPFDRHFKGDGRALSVEARRGMGLFTGKAGCIRCHDGPLFSDQLYHDVGLEPGWVPRSGVLYQVTHSFIKKVRGIADPAAVDSDVDLGRYYKSRRNADAGRFRTPTLRELKYTGPYMHDGRFTTLYEVVNYFDGGGETSPNRSSLMRPLGLTESEKRDLVHFLESLSSDRPPSPGGPALPPLRSLAPPGQ